MKTLLVYDITIDFDIKILYYSMMAYSIIIVYAIKKVILLCHSGFISSKSIMISHQWLMM